MNKRYFSIMVTLIAVIMFVIQQHAPLSKSSFVAPPDAPTTTAGLYPVIKVVDGDTIEIEKDGKATKVRLIGIDTPEVVDPRKPVQCFGREASDEAHRLLDGKSVRLEIDPSQDTYDKYGRLLAYVLLPDGMFFNEYMVTQGYAHEYTYSVPYKYQTKFKAAEKAARITRKGLWAPETCNGNTKQVAKNI